MTDAELIEKVQAALEVESRAELEHVLSCDDCYLFDQDDRGPFYCQAFKIEFRGYVPHEPTDGTYVPTLWSKTILAALSRQHPRI